MTSGRYRAFVGTGFYIKLWVHFDRVGRLTIAIGFALLTSGCATSAPITAPTATSVPIRVTPTPEPTELASFRIATVEAGAHAALLVPGYAATQTCERFRSSTAGCESRN